MTPLSDEGRSGILAVHISAIGQHVHSFGFILVIKIPKDLI